MFEGFHNGNRTAETNEWKSLEMREKAVVSQAPQFEMEQSEPVEEICHLFSFTYVGLISRQIWFFYLLYMFKKCGWQMTNNTTHVSNTHTLTTPFHFCTLLHSLQTFHLILRID